MSTNPPDPDILIIGGGIIGLSIAWQCQRNGYQVLLLEKGELERSTSWVAAGMLAPASELLPEKEAVYQDRKASLELYSRFLQELREDAGHAPRVHYCGSLWVELKRHDPSVLEHKLELWERLGVHVKKIAPQVAAERIGRRTERVQRAYELPEEAHINNRTLLKDLLQAFLLKGGEVRERTPACSIEGEGRGWRVDSPSGSSKARELILCAGAEGGRIEGIPQEESKLRSLKGMIVQLEGEPRPDAILRSPGCYLLAKGPKSLLLGATMEERADSDAYAGQLLELLQEGQALFPALERSKWKKVDIGHRPAFSDHEPRVERVEGNGMIRAEGHFRHGILSAPWTAYRILKLI